MWRIIAIVVMVLALGAGAKWFTGSYLAAAAIATVIGGYALCIRNNPAIVREEFEYDGL